MNKNSLLKIGSLFMLLGALSFIGYGILFFLRNFFGTGFELGVQTINGLTQSDLQNINSALVPYIGHLHVAIAGFIIATGIAVIFLSWYGVRQGLWWAWWGAVLSPVVGLAFALPLHYMSTFDYDWVAHLGPIYVGTFVFVIGSLFALSGLLRTQ